MSKTTRIGQLAAALGVIASLALVAYEVRQNTRAVTGQTMQALAQQHVDLSLVGVENAELREAYELGFTDLASMTQEQSSMLSWYYTAVMRVTENRFRQYQLETLSAEALKQFGAQGAVFRNPFFKAWWAERDWQFSEDFVAYVEADLLTLEGRELTPIVNDSTDR